MRAITIQISDEDLEKLEEMAARYGVEAEAQARAGVTALLERPDDAFQRALDHVLEKNAELYRRLA